MNEFLFGELHDKHEIIFANDRETAIRHFHVKAPLPWLYVPDKFIKTDSQGHWVGFYDYHLEVFVPEYTPDAGIPFSIKVGTEWKPIGTLSLSSELKVNRGLISGPRRLPGKS